VTRGKRLVVLIGQRKALAIAVKGFERLSVETRNLAKDIAYLP
jgi:hypothetical protein